MGAAVRSVLAPVLALEAADLFPGLAVCGALRWRAVIRHQFRLADASVVAEWRASHCRQHRLLHRAARDLAAVPAQGKSESSRKSLTRTWASR